MKKNSTISINEADFLPSELGDEMIIMDLETGDYIGLNPIGSDIWKLIKEPISLENLIKELVALYDVKEEQCKEDAIEFLTQMAEKKVIKIQ